MRITITDVLAAYGAILASVGFGWSLYRDLLDRARLQMDANVRRIVQSTDGKRYVVRPDSGIAGVSAQLFVVLDVANVGRRPVKWMGWGGKYHKRVNGKDSFAVVPVALPKMLDEGENHSEFTDSLDVAGENVKRLFIWDASGRHWNLSRRGLRELKSEARKFLQAP